MPRQNSTLTLSISIRLKKELEEIKGVNWSEETRQFLEKRVRRLRALRKLDDLTKNSELSEDDVIELGRRINERIAKRHARPLP